MNRPKKLLLIVEDDPMIRNLYQILLGKFFQIAVADSGDSGYSKAVELVPDCIFTDLFMPGSSGIEMVKRIRNVSTLNRIPVLLSSGNIDLMPDLVLSEFENCRIIHKPAPLAEVLKAFKEMLPK